MAEPDLSIAETIQMAAGGVVIAAAVGCVGSILWLIWSMGALIAGQTLGTFAVVLVAALVVGGVASQ